MIESPYKARPLTSNEMSKKVETPGEVNDSKSGKLLSFVFECGTDRGCASSEATERRL